MITVNPQFTYAGTWLYAAAIRRSTVIYPRRHTLTAGDSMTFTISQASAIFVHSEVNDDHGEFIVTFTPPPELGQPVTTIYDGNAHWLSLDRVLFWAAGMDRDKSYTVKITNIATSGTPYFDFSHVDILDATSVGPVISSTSLSPVSSSTSLRPVISSISLSRSPSVVRCLLTFFQNHNRCFESQGQYSNRRNCRRNCMSFFLFICDVILTMCIN